MTHTYLALYILVNACLSYVLWFINTALLMHYHRILDGAILPLRTSLPLKLWWWPSVFAFMGIVMFICSFTHKEQSDKTVWHFLVVSMLGELAFILVLPWLYYYPYLLM